MADQKIIWKSGIIHYVIRLCAIAFIWFIMPRAKRSHRHSKWRQEWEIIFCMHPINIFTDTTRRNGLIKKSFYCFFKSIFNKLLIFNKSITFPHLKFSFNINDFISYILYYTILNGFDIIKAIHITHLHICPSIMYTYHKEKIFNFFLKENSK